MRYVDVILAIGFLFCVLVSKPQAQPTLDFPIDGLIRLTGTLTMDKPDQASAYPQLAVWVGGEPGLFQVSHVEPVMPNYPAEEELRQVSGVGLRLLAEKTALAVLQDPQHQGSPIVMYGWLHVSEGTLNVRSVRAADGSAGTQ